MLTWLELDEEFRALGQIWARLDYQWGAAGTYYRVAGQRNAGTQRFEALAQIAGMKLSELPVGELHDDVMVRHAPEERWYEALKHHSASFEHGIVGIQSDSSGTHMGHIFSGHIQLPTAASSVLALKYSVLSAAPPAVIESAPEKAGFGSGLNAWLAKERQRRGMIWIVGAGLAGIILAALAL